MKSQKPPCPFARVLALALVAVLAAMVFTALWPADIKVYKTPFCECCKKWVWYLQGNGLSVETENVFDLASVKRRFSVPKSVKSCHTAVIDGYVVEGHVPVETMRRLLRERPAVKGIAVPGMPIGSPGMEGRNSQRYDVLTFDEFGRTEVFEHR